MTAHAGLDKVLPVKANYVEALGAWSSASGAMARLEAGRRLSPNMGVFGFAQADARGQSVGGGWRYSW